MLNSGLSHPDPVRSSAVVSRSREWVAVSEPAVAVTTEPAPVAAPAFHDHRWRGVAKGADPADEYLCDECGVTWSFRD
jgi:hypothetical protein